MTPSVQAGPRGPRGPQGLRRLLVAHRVFLPLLTLAIALRVVTMLGYRSVMWFPDSYDYVAAAVRFEPGLVRPSGYPLLLWLLEDFHSFTLVVLLQHAMGLGIAVMVYRLVRMRFGMPGWVGSLAAFPILFDAFQVQLEHMVLSDTLFVFLVVAALVALTGRVEVRTAAAAGGLLGLAALTRSVGLPLLVVAMGFLVVRRAGWRPLAAMAVLGALPLGIYTQWYATRYDRFELTGSSGVFLYNRAMAFADCRKMHPPVEEMPLCVNVEPSRRRAAGSYLWGPRMPLRRIPGGGFDREQNRLAGSFARRAVLAQPGDYLTTVGEDVGRSFQWGHPVYPDAATYDHYVFRRTAARPPETAQPALKRYEPGRVNTVVVEPYAGFLRGYQRYFYLRGTMLGVIMVVGLAGVIAGRRRGAGVALLPWSFAAVLVVAPAATAQFDYRYTLAAVPPACIAAALACSRRLSKASPGVVPAPRSEDPGAVRAAADSRESAPVAAVQ